MECNIGECYKLQVTNLNDVYGFPEQETNRIKRTPFGEIKMLLISYLRCLSN